MTDFPAHVRNGWTEEELALLRHADLAEDSVDAVQDDPASPAPIGFHERLVLGDLSW